MIRKALKWVFSPTQKPIIEDHLDLYSRLIEMEGRYQGLLMDVKRLEEENIETSNVLYELMENIRALDDRIDILAEHCRIAEDV
jgi:predicted nuclease with TOPRIM domain